MTLVALNNKRRMFILQFVGWGIICATTLLWSILSESSIFDQMGAIVLVIMIVTYVLIYLLNTHIFIPKYLFGGSRKSYFLCNAFVIFLLLVLSYLSNKYDWLAAVRPDNMPPRPRANLLFLLKDAINYILMVGLATALQLAERLQRSEEALEAAESARVKAELANLRSQINPHFLLNTLNNIYALTAIDAEKAQKTIKELSDLLRYVLYDNLNDRVSLLGEVEFLKAYIELMSIRLPRQVRLTTEFRVAEDCTTFIAPLIFISLIENAFKHSVGADGGGYIDIIFEDRPQRGEVVLSTRNSNNAKAEEDKSGHGIGLEQVRRRLELLYPDSYSWDVEQTDGEYRSVLTIRVCQ